MQRLFWIAALGIGYVYVGYPLLLVIWAAIRPRHLHRSPQCWMNPPRISIVIAARNEAARLQARIENLLSLHYPQERREIIVVSDGSTDDTLAVLSQHRHVLEAVAAPPLGKAAALNVAVARATGDILVFADARQTFAPDALLALVAPFTDPAVGGVTGELILDCETADQTRRGTADRRQPPQADRRSHGRGPGRRHGVDRRGLHASTIGEGVGLYWRYEKQLRRLESTIGSTLGATGAIYALRRHLYRPLPPDTILDDVLTPMRAVLAGYRVVFSDRAIAFDRASADARAERRRKVRTLAGNFQVLWQEPRLLVPGINPVWLQYLSHKVGRLLVPYALLALLVASVALAPGSVFYSIALTVQGALYSLAAYGAWLDSHHADHAAHHGWAIDRLARVALTFLVMNYAAMAGLASVVTRRSVWR